LDLEQKYIGDRDFEMEEVVWYEVKKLPEERWMGILHQIDWNLSLLEKTNGWVKSVSGVSMLHDNPLYFKFEYLNQKDEIPIFVDFEIITLDTYLDYVLDKKIFQNEHTRDKKNRHSDTI
jgi:hypothetical protein